MFEIGFSELLLVALVALLVLGPDRLPGAARTAGLWIGRLKRSLGNLRTEVEREIGADEIRRQLHNERILEMERQLKESVDRPLSSLLNPETARSDIATNTAAESPSEPHADITAPAVASDATAKPATEPATEPGNPAAQRPAPKQES